MTVGILLHNVIHFKLVQECVEQIHQVFLGAIQILFDCDLNRSCLDIPIFHVFKYPLSESHLFYTVE